MVDSGMIDYTLGLSEPNKRKRVNLQEPPLYRSSFSSSPIGDAHKHFYGDTFLEQAQVSPRGNIIVVEYSTIPTLF